MRAKFEVGDICEITGNSYVEGIGFHDCIKGDVVEITFVIDCVGTDKDLFVYETESIKTKKWDYVPECDLKLISKANESDSYETPETSKEVPSEVLGGTVTEKHIEDIIKNSKFIKQNILDKTVVIVCTLPNGFVLVESSSCVDPANFDFEIGEEICMKEIENKIWKLEGYLLQQKLWEEQLKSQGEKL